MQPWITLFKHITLYAVLKHWIETVGFEKGELTKESFIQLYKIEAQRDDTDVNDISSRLANMGFNKSLTIDQVDAYLIG